MAIRNRRFRDSNGGLSPYMLWVLCGFVLGHTIVQNPKHKRFASIILRNTKVVINIDIAAIKSLLRRELISSKNTGEFVISGRGFAFAHERLKQTGIKFKNWKKAATETSIHLG